MSAILKAPLLADGRVIALAHLDARADLPLVSKGLRRHCGGRLLEMPRRVCCLDLPFLLFFCAFSIGSFGAFFEAISALS